MLVLSRNVGERIILDDQIVVEVIEIRGDKVRFGIEAPPEIVVHREEIWRAIQRSREADIGGEA